MCGSADSHLANLEHGEIIENDACVELAHLLEVYRRRLGRLTRFLARTVAVLRKLRKQRGFLVNEEGVDGGDAVVELLLEDGLSGGMLVAREPFNQFLQCLQSQPALTKR